MSRACTMYVFAHEILTFSSSYHRFAQRAQLLIANASRKDICNRSSNADGGELVKVVDKHHKYSS